MVSFPRPCYNRIPNFKGSDEAAAKLTELDVYKNAQNVKVNPDKPQEHVRFHVLEHNKNLYVPIPRLSNGLLKHILLDENRNKNSIRKAISRNGIEEYGKDIGVTDELKIDLVVLGSVAVSKEGNTIRQSVSPTNDSFIYRLSYRQRKRLRRFRIRDIIANESS